MPSQYIDIKWRKHSASDVNQPPRRKAAKLCPTVSRNLSSSTFFPFLTPSSFLFLRSCSRRASRTAGADSTSRLCRRRLSMPLRGWRRKRLVASEQGRKRAEWSDNTATAERREIALASAGLLQRPRVSRGCLSLPRLRQFPFLFQLQLFSPTHPPAHPPPTRRASQRS